MNSRPWASIPPATKKSSWPPGVSSRSHYATAPANVVFEILNEPSRKLTPSLWNEYLADALAVIRKTNPSRTVIVGPGYWNSIDHLSELELPATDTNLIVTVHYYTPMDFTHQGAAWVDRKDKLGVDWLGTDKDLSLIKTNFDKASSWAKDHHRPVFLGEFGTYDKAPMDSRASLHRRCRPGSRATWLELGLLAVR